MARASQSKFNEFRKDNSPCVYSRSRKQSFALFPRWANEHSLFRAVPCLLDVGLIATRIPLPCANFTVRTWYRRYLLTTEPAQHNQSVMLMPDNEWNSGSGCGGWLDVRSFVRPSLPETKSEMVKTAQSSPKGWSRYMLWFASLYTVGSSPSTSLTVRNCAGWSSSFATDVDWIVGTKSRATEARIVLCIAGWQWENI